MNLAVEAERLSSLIDKGVAALTKTASDLALAERDYRLARALAWPRTEGTAREREDQVNSITAEDRMQRDLAEGQRVAALEALRSRRAQLSALQSVANAERAEAEFVRTGPGRMQP